MGVTVDLKYIKELGGAKYRFRKPYPVDLRQVLGQNLRRTKTIHTHRELLIWREQLLQEWDQMVASQSKRQTVPAQTAREMWFENRAEAIKLLQGVDVPDEDDARFVLIDSIESKYPSDPDTGCPVDMSNKDHGVWKALATLDAAPPEPTLQDAMALYLQEKVGNVEGRRGRNSRGSVERVFGFAFDALGDRATLPLRKLGSADGRVVRDAMCNRAKANGRKVAGKSQSTAKISPTTVRRELNILVTALERAISGFDLDKGNIAKNIFKDLEITGLSEMQERELRAPLPPEIVAGISKRLETLKERQGSALPALRLIWRLLKGTGCRVAEVSGLRVDDVITMGTYPHIKVRWNEDRRLKNKTSTRSVPLLGDALEAAKKALNAAGGNGPLFPRYGGANGGNNASAALMKHVSAVAKSDRHKLHSLRHNMTDLLRLSGASERAEKLILGHKLGGVGDRVYGGSPADLELTYKAMVKAHRRARDEAN